MSSEKQLCCSPVLWFPIAEIAFRPYMITLYTNLLSLKCYFSCDYSMALTRNFNSASVYLYHCRHRIHVTCASRHSNQSSSQTSYLTPSSIWKTPPVHRRPCSGGSCLWVLPLLTEGKGRNWQHRRAKPWQENPIRADCLVAVSIGKPRYLKAAFCGKGKHLFPETGEDRKLEQMRE